MPRVKEVEFGFENYDRHSRTPGPAEPSKNGSTAAEGASVARLVPPSGLDDWFRLNERLAKLVRDPRSLDGIAATCGMLAVMGLHWWLS